MSNYKSKFTGEEVDERLSLAEKIPLKQDKEEGKGLSSNNYTDEDKALVGGIRDVSKNVITNEYMLNKSHLTNGYLIDRVNGEISPSSNYSATEGFYYINDKCKLTVKATRPAARGSLSFYDADKKFISSTQDFDIDTYTEVAIPTYAQYFRICCSITDQDKFSVCVTNILDDFIGNGENIVALTGKISGVADVLGVQVFDKSVLSTGGYILKSNGTVAQNADYSYTNDYYPITYHSRLVVRTTLFIGNAGLVFYDSNKKFLSVVQDFGIDTIKDISDRIPLAAAFFRLSCKTSDSANFMFGYRLQEEQVTLSNYADGISIIDGKSIMGMGASFMRSSSDVNINNTWLSLLASKFNVAAINTAVGGTNIMYHANMLYDGSLLIDATNISAIVIMHTHNKNVFDLPIEYKEYSVEDYEQNVLPFSTTTGSDLADVEYAKAFDYVIKKIKKIYFDTKQTEEYATSVQTYMGKNYVTPCQIVLATHWHDGRAIYNAAIRKLSNKWGLPLIQFDTKIGFRSSLLNPSTGCQASLEFVGNTNGPQPIEKIDGIYYGWHPMCGEDAFIQKKMAAIASLSFIE